jgi:alpha-mannosidase
MSKKNTIYLVPHTHYDAVWVFTKEDYLYINIELILKKAIKLIEENDYKFLIEQTYLLEKIEKRNPLLFEKIRKFIKENKIEIADGEYLMADTMLPSGETLVREILFGKRYVKEKFNKETPVMWQADSFGLNAQLPQIYKKSGYKYVAFRRGAAQNKPSEFWWQALDGTRVLTHWMPLGYRAGLDLNRLEESYQKLKKIAATQHILMPSGSGVTMPQPETAKAANKWNQTHPNSEMKITLPTEFFKALEKQAKNLKTRAGEMYSGKFSEVFPNVCSSRIWIKQKLRKYENFISSAEKWATLAWLLNHEHPQSELSLCWKRILFAGFHDVAPGTGIDQCYGELKSGFSFLKTHLTELSQNSMAIISRGLRGDIIVFNSLSWEVKNWVECEMKFEKGKIKKIEGLKSGKEKCEIEILESAKYEDNSLQKVKLGFIANVPALGYKTFEILEKLPKFSDKNKLKTIGNTIENKFFKIKIDPSTGLIDIFQNNHWVSRGNDLILEEEIGDLYYHRQNLKSPLKTESGEGIKYGQFKVENFEIRKSKIRTIINLKEDYYSLRWPYRLTEKKKPLLWRHKFISVIEKIIVYKDLPRIDFITKIDNRHPQIRIRVKFSTDINSLTYHCESQFGVVQRPVNQYYATSKNWKEKPCGIYPSLNWLDYSNKEKGITIIHKGTPANEVRDNNIYLTLIRSVVMLSSDGRTGPPVPVPDAAEFKKYTFFYSAFPHSGDWKKANSWKIGYEYNYKLISVQIPEQKLSKPPRVKTKSSAEFSFLEIKPKNLVLTALKKAEDGNEIILRFFETKGEKTKGEINLFKKPREVKLVNLLEQETQEISELKNNLTWRDKKIKITANPFEIITLKITLTS